MKSGAANVYGTRGRDMCLAEIEASGEDQGLKPTQADARSLYWSAIWPSITSRYRKEGKFEDSVDVRS